MAKRNKKVSLFNFLLVLQKELGSSILAKMLLYSMMKKESKFLVDLKGLGISLIDNEPKELLYLSIYKMQFMQEKWTEQVSQKEQDLDGLDIERVNE